MSIRPRNKRFAAAIVAAGVLAAGPALGESLPPDVKGDPAPGTRLRVDPDNLPEPYAGESVANPPRTVARDGRRPRAPEGFEVTLFADGLDHARWLTVADNGDVFLAESDAGKITLLRDANGDGRADTVKPFATGFNTPTGMVIHDGHFYVADLDGIWRFPYSPGADAPAGERRRITPRGAFGGPGGHWTRTLTLGPGNETFYVGIGSRGNLAVEPAPRATIKAFPVEGGSGVVFASGLRNPVGVAFRPGTDDLYTVVNERDGLGDALVPDYLTRVVKGGFYGWPYAYLDGRPQPGFADKAPAKVEATRMPDLLFRAHSAPLGLVFPTAGVLPGKWAGGAYVALHGSWNAQRPRGYMVVHVPFEDGAPRGDYRVFLSGFRVDGGTRARVWGRPVGLAEAPDGALLVADDTGQTVWRVAPADAP